MNTSSPLPAMPADLRNAVLCSYTAVTEDGTLCYVSDKVHRTCSECETVYAGSVSSVALGGSRACPYCGGNATSPLPERWFS